jgi:hypothetical protein
MQPVTAMVASVAISYTAYVLYSNSNRMQKKFYVAPVEAVRLDDLTQPNALNGFRAHSREKDSLL